ncbi:TMCO1/EMC3 family protein [Candidatus Woesearchaeota archaeon]|nr:TMCO1/EMC3 family protein [Candidatus Woesearchaeota archaeon]
MLNSLLDPVLRPLLYINPLLSIVIIAFVISLIVTLAYKFLTNQSLMKDLRKEQKELQKKMKELKNHPEKLMKVQSDMMEINMKYMTHSMKPTLFTFIPIILIFGWLNTHMAYYPLYPEIPFEVTVIMDKAAAGKVSLDLPEGVVFVDSNKEKEILNNEVSWYIKGSEGEYDLDFYYNEETYSKKILITAQREYYTPSEKIKSPFFKEIRIVNEKVRPLEGIPVLDGLNWFWTYVVFSLIFSMSLRRLMKIY